MSLSFEDYTQPEPNTGCTLWAGALSAANRGRYNYNGRIRFAHCVAYERMHGPIPPGMFVLHSCDVSWCVNPAHLHLGTAALNAQERELRRRGAKFSRARCKQGHLFTPANTYYWKTNTRLCRTCRARWDRRKK